MRRFHVHVSVDDLAKSTAFYTNLFGQPTRVEPDYVKWMVEDPRLNFAISKRGAQTGINHLGLQVDSDEDLKSMRAQLEAADAGLVADADASCCYAKSDKYWITDPQGIAWETYHTLGSIPTFGGSESGTSASAAAAGCFMPAADTKVSAQIPVKAKACCA